LCGLFTNGFAYFERDGAASTASSGHVALARTYLWQKLRAMQTEPIPPDMLGDTTQVQDRPDDYWEDLGSFLETYPPNAPVCSSVADGIGTDPPPPPRTAQGHAYQWKFHDQRPPVLSLRERMDVLTDVDALRLRDLICSPGAFALTELGDPEFGVSSGPELDRIAAEFQVVEPFEPGRGGRGPVA
jgi:hypothetical protein